MQLPLCEIFARPLRKAHLWVGSPGFSLSTVRPCSGAILSSSKHRVDTKPRSFLANDRGRLVEKSRGRGKSSFFKASVRGLCTTFPSDCSDGGPWYSPRVGGFF